MKKVKLEAEENLPPMPTGDKAEGPESYSPSTISSESEPESPAISEELAGDLIGLPFDAWHLFNPIVLPLSELEKERLAGPFSRILEKYGMGKIARDEIVFGFYLTAVVYGRIKVAREEKARQKLIIKGGENEGKEKSN